MRRPAATGRALGAPWSLFAVEGRVLSVEAREPRGGSRRRPPLRVQLADDAGEVHVLEFRGARPPVEEGRAWTAVGAASGADAAPRWFAVRDRDTGRAWIDPDALAAALSPLALLGALGVALVAAALAGAVLLDEVAGYALASPLDRVLAFVIGLFCVAIAMIVARVPARALAGMRGRAVRSDPAFRELVPEPE